MNRIISFSIIVLLLIATLSCSTESTPIYSLSVTANPSEAGSVTPSSGEYEQGERVEITATPNDGWMFDSWQGDHTGSSNPASVTMSSDKQISARFVERTYPLTINTEGEGTVQENIISQKTTDYEEGTVVELTAEPADGWRFVRWEGDLEGSENPATIEVDSEKTVTAVFERRDYPLTINVDGEGTVAEEVIQAKTTDYPYETNVQLTANPSEGWVFSHWEGDVTGSENPSTIEVTNEKTVTAVFEREMFAISYTLNGEGQVTETLSTGTKAEDGSYEFESTVVISAVPAEGWQFIGWAGDLQGTDNPQTVTIDSDKSVTANFDRKDYPLTINIQGEGTVAEEVIQAKTTDYPYETNVQLTANPADGWVFSRWEGDVTGSANPSTVEVTNEKTVAAVFEKTFYLHPNGVTIMCPNTSPGDKGLVNGIEYESVDRVLLSQRRDDGSDLSKVCVSLITNMSYTFSGTPFNQDISNWDVSSVTEMIYMFHGTPFNQDISNWDVSSVTNMLSMFEGTPFNQDISTWDVSSVTNMSLMFTRSQFNQSIGNWDVSSVTDMSSMFEDTPFNQDISTWDVNSVTTMRRMFFSTPFNKSINNWDVSSVTDMSFLFMGSFFNQPIGNWDVSSVIDMSSMFEGTDFNQPIGNWNVSAVSYMGRMFSGTPFNQSITSWNVSSVTNMQEMFYRATNFNQDISNWDVSSVTNMSFMFNRSQFNQPIGNWNVSSVNNMQAMFALSPFNQPIGSWDVSSVTNMSGMFLSTPFNQSIGNWDVGAVNTMEEMFYASEFNQPIGNWNVSSVNNMNKMFRGIPNSYTNPFNQDIGNWNVSSVVYMEEMFYSSEFNQQINTWCVEQITSEPSLFSASSPLIEDNKPVWGTCPSN
ncbi:BspA family leucine-rich repeat surface protein [Rhodohalobacter barkolensis]|uniref:Bacterial repeat domain-containing protein n=1 Tax=Rhodohalobacter barkolensis TaxID=2053187 RepID=A0A2N0VHP0_9BACT|nr:BspA family leucine-rich repeat surface protein [Rhodohalobacter barkolensis]PKD43707.1 hypothetical protein CWD77_09105 [Rhodohalobacter barkolensis]